MEIIRSTGVEIPLQHRAMRRHDQLFNKWIKIKGVKTWNWTKNLSLSPRLWISDIEMSRFLYSGCIINYSLVQADAHMRLKVEYTSFAPLPIL